MIQRILAGLRKWLYVEEVKNFISPIPDFIVCESYPGYSKHIRKVNADIHYGGYAMPKMALCGKVLDVGWDTRFSLPDIRGWCMDSIDRPCAGCQSAYTKQLIL